ncbi:maleylacetoacetate isomerase [Albidovulum sediminis]|uniref:Maleylacetoacetate isomerase n=1 Tax=Albidovulum sediminis TaxID=3066345 RepID=A0ABT2NQK8_9RHOB|nr:maleylacetoacetate isomerase [Defluviimonas sediminis]MCT8331176.1 maleylacetoacetate isomerase [Defluviimonas sediminis]
MPETVLYDYWRSSAAYRVRIALNLLGLPWRPVTVDLLAGEQAGADNLARNPQGLVPTLEIDGHSLTQSLAILEYLDETRAPGWLPKDPIERAVVRAMAHAVAMDIHPVCNLRVARHAVSLGATMEGWMGHFIGLGLEGLEGLLLRHPEGRFCHGDSVTLADICLVPQVYNARRWTVDLQPFPRVVAIAEALECLPAFMAAHPDRVKLAG